MTTPKELLPLGGKPLIAHAIAEARRAGFESAVVVVSRAKESLVRYLHEAPLALPVETVYQPEPLGIGEAVLRCWQGQALGVLLPDDVVLETRHWKDLIEVHRRTGAATLCVRPVPPDTISRFGIAECDGDRILALHEKPAPGTTSSNLAVFGRYVVTPAVADGLRRLSVEGELELTYGFNQAASSHTGVRAVPFDGQIFDCGTPNAYVESQSAFSQHSRRVAGAA